MGIIKNIIDFLTDSPDYKGMKGEKAVKKSLNPFFSFEIHKQINNLVLLDELGKSHQIDHIDIRSNGIFVIETKNYSGWIFGSEDQPKWTQVIYRVKNQFLNPIKQNKSHCYHVSKALDGKFKVHSVVVFVQNNAPAEVKGVVNLNGLADYLAAIDDGEHLTYDTMFNIYDSLLSCNQKVSTSDHIQNIKKTQEEIEDNICPRCGGRLIKRQGKYGEFTGCCNYPNCRFTLKN